MAIFGHILETDRKFGEFYGRQTTVRELLGKVIKREKWDCSVDELNLYFPRKNGQRLQVNDPEYFDLEQGELSDGLREIMSDANRIDLDTRIRSFSATCEYDFLLEAPPRIRRKYRRSVAEIRRYFIGANVVVAKVVVG
ncbi:hypothetical protein P3T76_013187 [Phytophthora citrophthora]|uniref:Uncharacterized protein n=1 Tax=Phytophthora citrophthora TaxID=4793 RepID=A0AAD9LCH9_9STRA|nr:hypothetical protein P3T76_013187 [Phytophthora citrophthora]